MEKNKQEKKKTQIHADISELRLIIKIILMSHIKRKGLESTN
jgi:hypothetical protein